MFIASYRVTLCVMMNEVVENKYLITLRPLSDFTSGYRPVPQLKVIESTLSNIKNYLSR